MYGVVVEVYLLHRCPVLTSWVLCTWVQLTCRQEISVVRGGVTEKYFPGEGLVWREEPQVCQGEVTTVYALESSDNSALPKLPVPFNQFSLQDNVLCRTVTITKDVVTQLVISVAFVVLQLLHDVPSSGYPGRDSALAAAWSKYYWPTMRINIEKQVSCCPSCAQTKGSTTTAPILEYPHPAEPFDVVGLDLLQLPRLWLHLCLCQPLQSACCSCSTS